jgi:hypothetical protein
VTVRSRERGERGVVGDITDHQLEKEDEYAMASVSESRTWWRRRVVRWRRGDAGDAFRRWQYHPRDRIRVRTVGWRQWQWTSYPEPLAPASSYMHCATGAHQPNTGWASLIRTQDQGPHLAVGPSMVEIKLTFFLDLSSLFSFFNFLLKISIHIFLASFLFHYRLVHRTVPSSQQLVSLD